MSDIKYSVIKSVVIKSFDCNLSVYKDSYKPSFPIQESTEKLLKVPCLDDLMERLLIKKNVVVVQLLVLYKVFFLNHINQLKR